MTLPAERALQQVTAVSYARHDGEGLLPVRRSSYRAACTPRRYPLAAAHRDCWRRIASLIFLGIHSLVSE
ncbi:hypothetical protein I546_1762 [Mycobacterium kansasii 732]|uniref:Uncharacterized protein n=1 Tax=Mycobacterium kansasii TaxID=1768 RepID=A0A1V3XJT1_MYCKA|nr:hypothetical protein I547_4228 [Mycobacterium kansasii 824]EUA12986.1 hypothetical protein I546_1762 [Mycobacterium kansasii 732]OOK79358.1 hypothetical protein BZL30_1813 [Mycobacterium kansasii]OOK80253.1 hypothetical protein BZL29_1870 [Mycobacterium kansasii]